MKKCYIPVSMIILLILSRPGNGYAQPCMNGTLHLGTIDSNWLYKNTDFKISFQLPGGWYLYDQVATEKKYLRIGSDYRKMSEVLYADGPGPTIDMAQVKALPFEYALTLLSTARLEDTAAVVLSENEKKENDCISFRAYYADTTDANQFLKLIYKKVSGKNEGPPEIKDGRLGELDYKYFRVSVRNKADSIENWIFGVRNFGCLNLVIRIIYTTDADLSLLVEAYSGLKFDD